MYVTTIARLKASLSELLAGVRAGEEVVVTDRGRPIARIVPYEASGSELDDLVRAGAVRRARRQLPGGFWDEATFAAPDGRLLGALLEERESGR